MGDLSGKVAAITGAGAGIGRAAAQLFAAQGARVALLEIEDSGGEAEREICAAGGQAEFIRTDVADYASVQAAFQRIRTTWGALHVLYNNASVFLGGRDGPVTELPLSVWERILAVNLQGLFYCCREGIALMLDSGGGSVITTSSSAGVIGIPRCDAYTATKGATIALTRSMAVEYGPRGIRVNCLAPAAIRTQMVVESNLKDPTFDEAAFLRTTPVRRWGEPEEIARIALFLASEASSYLNGAVIVADGGITIA